MVSNMTAYDVGKWDFIPAEAGLLSSQQCAGWSCRSIKV
jgi:hypothetical protein